MSSELSLSKGITVPLEYFLDARDQSRLLGPRGGEVVTYDNMPRRLNNSLFIDLANKGWIGSDEKGTELLVDLVSNILDKENSVIEARVFSQE